MDYKKIYNNFILYRREKEKSISGYFEKHHIIPKCLGGNNSKSNLINLTPEDHYFAHLLLARIHGGKMIFALNAMANLNHKNMGRPCFSKKRNYSYIRKLYAKEYSKNYSGGNSFSADQKTYTFKNHNGDKITGKRYEIKEITGLSSSNISCLINGGNHNIFGWYYPILNNGMNTKELYRASKLTDQKKYKLYHYDGSFWSGRKVNFLDEFGRPLYFQKTNGCCFGWYKRKSDAENHFVNLKKKCLNNSRKRGDISGLKNPRAIKKKYHFINFKTLEERKCTRVELAEQLLIKPSVLSCLFSLRQKSVRDWGLYKIWIKKDFIKTQRKDRL